MPFFTLPTDALLWPAGKPDAHGEPTLGPPVPIKCRWEERRGQTVNAQGQPIFTDGMVWVDQFVQEGSVLWRGKLKDYDPNTAQRLMRVEYYEEIPDDRGRQFERTCHIVRYKGKLPS